MMVSLSTLYLAPMLSTVNGGLPLLALPFFRVVYVDTDARVCGSTEPIGRIIKPQKLKIN